MPGTPDEPEEAQGKGVGGGETAGEVLAQRTPAKSEIHEQPYIDILPREILAMVTKALDDALVARPQAVWPARFPTKATAEDQRTEAAREVVRGKTALRVLVPLARLGATQGYSGASVYIAYFTDPRPAPSGSYYPSRPLVVKIGERTKLKAELLQAESWPHHAQGEDASFAYPWHVYSEESPKDPALGSVLVGHFSSVNLLNPESEFYDFKITDLWQVLTTSSTQSDGAEGVLRSVYELMYGIQRNGRVVCERCDFQYGKEYSKYLRGQHTTHRQSIEGLFGVKSDTQMFGQVWPNPLKLVDELIGVNFTGVAGPLHGDLHPKNVVLDKTGRPRIIDFGWAHSRGHFVIDYVLMEVNLRALTLSAQISHGDVMSLAQMLADEDPVPVAPEVGPRAKLIRGALWATVQNLDIVKDWTSEYLVPQFLIAFGLLKYLDNSKNQYALLCTVLCLAQRIRKHPPMGISRSIS